MWSRIFFGILGMGLIAWSATVLFTKLDKDIAAAIFIVPWIYYMDCKINK